MASSNPRAWIWPISLPHFVNLFFWVSSFTVFRLETGRFGPFSGSKGLFMQENKQRQFYACRELRYLALHVKNVTSENWRAWERPSALPRRAGCRAVQPVTQQAWAMRTRCVQRGLTPVTGFVLFVTYIMAPGSSHVRCLKSSHCSFLWVPPDTATKVHKSADKAQAVPRAALSSRG